jgi:hypothetical protein
LREREKAISITFWKTYFEKKIRDSARHHSSRVSAESSTSLAEAAVALRPHRPHCAGLCCVTLRVVLDDELLIIGRLREGGRVIRSLLRCASLLLKCRKFGKWFWLPEADEKHQVPFQEPNAVPRIELLKHYCSRRLEYSFSLWLIIN